MVSDEKAIEAFEKQFKAIEDKERTVIIEGFPRTVKQALYLKNKGVMPDALIVANQSQVHSISSLQERGGLSLAQA
jgi:adenylate kinase family enzyme